MSMFMILHLKAQWSSKGGGGGDKISSTLKDLDAGR